MSTTTVATGSTQREVTAGKLLRIAEARTVASSGAIITPMTECNVAKITFTTPTPTEIDWAEGNLGDLKTIVQQTRVEGPRGQVRIQQDSNGHWWRFGGNVDLRIVGGTYRFQISLYRGANRDDFEHLLRSVDQAKSGAFLNSGWEPYTDRNENTAYAFRCGRHYATSGEASIFDTAVDNSPQIVVCTDDRCTLTVHEAFGSTHVADSIDGARWHLSVDRYVDGEHEDERYEVSVHVTDALTDAEVVAFTNDLAWIQESCRRANAKAAA